MSSPTESEIVSDSDQRSMSPQDETPTKRARTSIVGVDSQTKLSRKSSLGDDSEGKRIKTSIALAISETPAGELPMNAKSIHGQNESFVTSPGIDLTKIVGYIKEHQRHAANCKRGDVALVLGTTGVGKTTMLCWVLGSRITMEKVETTVHGRARVKDAMVVENPPSGLEVGHDAFKSKTRHLRCYKCPQTNMQWCDTPGSADTEGSEVDIANAVAITHTIRSCRSVRPILLINSRALPAERGKYLRSLLSMVQRLITNDFSKNVASLLVFFTHADEQTSEELWFMMKEFLQDDVSSEIAAFVDHVCKLLDQHKDNLILRPVAKSPDAVTKLVHESKAIQNLGEVFGCPLSEEDRGKLQLACQMLGQDVAEGLRSSDFAKLRTCLDELKLLSETTHLEIVDSEYSVSIERAWKDFDGKLKAAWRRLAEHQFARVSQFLEEVRDDLLVHTRHWEITQEVPIASTLEEQREALTLRINEVASELTMTDLDQAGSESYERIGKNLDTLKDLSTCLSSQLLPRNKDAYKLSVKAIETRMDQYSNEIASLIKQRNFTTSDASGSQIVGTTSMQKESCVAVNLPSCFDMLLAATPAVEGHVTENHLSHYKISQAMLEKAIEASSVSFVQQLEKLASSVKVNVNKAVRDLSLELNILVFAGTTMSKHIGEKHVQSFRECERALEKTECQESERMDCCLAQKDFANIEIHLRRMDAITQLLGTVAKQRFHTKMGNFSYMIEQFAIEIHSWLSKKESEYCSYELCERMSGNLRHLRQACDLRSGYLEDGREYIPSGKKQMEQADSVLASVRTLPLLEGCRSAEDKLSKRIKNLRQACDLRSEYLEDSREHIPSGGKQMEEADGVLASVMTLPLLEGCRSAEDKILKRIKRAIDSSIETLKGKQYDELAETVDMLNQMWPFHCHFDKMPQQYTEMSSALGRHAKELLDEVVQRTMPTAEKFDCAKIREVCAGIADFSKVLRKCSAGELGNKFCKVSESKMFPEEVVESATKEARENIIAKLKIIRKSAEEKLCADKFEVPEDEIEVLKAMKENLFDMVGEAAKEGLDKITCIVDECVGTFEDKFRIALCEDNLNDAEAIVVIIEKAQVLHWAIPRVEHLLTKLRKDLTCRKEAFVQQVDGLLTERLYDELNKAMHGAQRQLKSGTPQERSTWKDALGLVIKHFDTAQNVARSIIREARACVPLSIDVGKFAKVVECMKMFEDLGKTGHNGCSLSSLLPDFESWCSSLQSESEQLLNNVLESGRRTLNKWHFVELPRISADLRFLVGLPMVGQVFEGRLREFEEAVTNKLDRLDDDLASMIEYGYHSSGLIKQGEPDAVPNDQIRPTPDVGQRCNTDPMRCTCKQCTFKCTVKQWRIDMLFKGVLNAIDCSLPHDFDQLYEQLLLSLESRVARIYETAKKALRNGDMDALEELVRGAERLQGSSNITTNTSYNKARHEKLIEELTSRKEDFMSKRYARADPEGFRKRLNELQEADWTTYQKKLRMLKEDLCKDKDLLQQQIRQLSSCEEQNVDSVIARMEDMSSYNRALEGHGESDLHLEDVQADLKARMTRLTKEVSQAKQSGTMEDVENRLHFLSSALEGLKASNEGQLVAIASKFDSDVQSMKLEMNTQVKEARDKWSIISQFDPCQSEPPTSDVVDFISFLEKSKVQTTDDNGNRISFSDALQQINFKFGHLDLDSIWVDCTKAHSSQEPKLAVVLKNVSFLAHELSKSSFPQVRQSLIQNAQDQMKALQDQTLALFTRVQEQFLPADEEKASWKKINELLEECVRARRAMEGICAIEDEVIPKMKSRVTEINSRFCRVNSDIDAFVHHLVSIFKVADCVSNKEIGKHVRSMINDILNEARKRNTSELGDLATKLCDYGPLGGQIVNDFDQFRQFQIERMKNKTAGMTFDNAFNQLKEMNPTNSEMSFRLLRENWLQYESEYQKHMSKHMFRQPVELFEEVKLKMQLFKDKDVAAPKVPQLLAGICAAVSMEMSDKDESARRTCKDAMMQPHPVQILALLRLLGVDEKGSWLTRSFQALCDTFRIPPSGSTESHLIQISTGEGKSIVLGILSIFLALWGFHVDCVCYSKYLSERDYRSFSRLFEGFGVQEQVAYGTFGELARRHVNQGGDVRAGTRALINQNLKDNAVDDNAFPKILLIDEVDVFFSRDFYGALYKPSTLIQSPQITELLKYIWNSRGQQITLQQVQAAPVYQTLVAAMPSLPGEIIDLHISAMIHATTTYTSPEHAWVLEDGKIGYVEHGTVNTTLAHGYNTTCAYFKEHMESKVSLDIFEENMGLNVLCGRFSYAEIPLAYQRILGVTGTLDSLGKFEQKVIKNVYKINRFTLTPSMYGKKDSSFDQGVHVEQGVDMYHRKILDDIKEVVAAERAVLVFFESEQKLKEFRNSAYGQRLTNPTEITSGKVEFIEHYVKQATRSKEVTLFPRVFGRGLDFVCFDKSVISRGGVAVIQTFLSEDIAEEIQIKGRTCRQGEKGTYKMILLAEDLVNWNDDKVNAKGAGSKRATGASFVSAGDLQEKSGLYAKLDKKRKAWFNEDSKARSRIVDSAKREHDRSLKYQELLVHPKSTSHDEPLACLLDFNRSIMPYRPYHIVFCLDESGSMIGASWDQLKTAFKQFIQLCLDQGGGRDIVSVVQFAHQARQTLAHATLEAASNFELQMQSGGTNFSPALQQAGQLFRSAPQAYSQMLVFMSDGMNSDGDVTDDMRDQARCFRDLACHTIFFGHGGSENLKRMAECVPNGKYHLSVDGVELLRTFSAIASDVTAL